MTTALRDVATSHMAFVLGRKFTGGNSRKLRNGRQMLMCRLDGVEMTCCAARDILEPLYCAKGLHK